MYISKAMLPSSVSFANKLNLNDKILDNKNKGYIVRTLKIGNKNSDTNFKATRFQLL